MMSRGWLGFIMRLKNMWDKFQGSSGIEAPLEC
jgi:hypothetical protein